MPLLTSLTERLAHALPLAARARIYDVKPLRRMAARVVDAALPESGIVELSGREGEGIELDLRFPEERLFWMTSHELDVTATVLGLLGPGRVLYDVGAHFGYLSFLAANAGARAVAFEPEPSSLARLRRNCDLNPTLQVQVVSTAIGSSVGETTITTDRGEGVNRIGAGTAVVPLTTIDHHVASGAFPPDVVKIDVEGAEGDVLRGAARVLREHAPTVVCEVHGPEPADAVLAALSEAGYTTYLLTSKEPFVQAEQARYTAGAAPHVIARPAPGVSQATRQPHGASSQAPA